MVPGSDAIRPVLIGNEWVLPTESFEVRAPFGNRLLANVGLAAAAEADRCVEAAAAAMRDPLPAWRRAELLEAIAARIDERASEFAELICEEAGKPIKIAAVEANRGAGVFRLAAAEARTLAGEVVPTSATPRSEDHFGWTLRIPIGVIAAITPFNFPLNLSAHKLAPALAAGCAVVHKPAEKTPLTALLLADVYREVDVPPGWLNTICGDAPAIGAVFADDDRVRMISFTGSDRVGWGLRERASRKKVALELGSISPVIVSADANLELAAEKVVTHAFGYSGQTCVSVQQVLVDETVLETFAGLLVPAIEALTIGDPADERTDLGPMIEVAAQERITAWTEEAIAAGARLLAGGGEEGGCLRPALLADVPPEVKLGRCEAFGPVCVLRSFAHLEEAYELSNATEFGLQAGIFTSSIETAMKAAKRLEFGSVLVNEASEWRADEIPYGGTKASGNTKEGPHAAVREMTEERLVVLGPGS